MIPKYKEAISIKKIMVLLLVAALSLSTSGFTFAESNDYKIMESTEEKYVESLAQKLDVSVEEAYQINQEENQKLLSSKDIQTRSLDEVLKYKTLIGSKVISNSNNLIMMATEIKYVYSNVQQEPMEILGVGGPHMYVYGITVFTINGGDYNIDLSDLR